MSAYSSGISERFTQTALNPKFAAPAMSQRFEETKTISSGERFSVYVASA
jgi:hypothetical protein